MSKDPRRPGSADPEPEGSDFEPGATQTLGFDDVELLGEGVEEGAIENVAEDEFGGGGTQTLSFDDDAVEELNAPMPTFPSATPLPRAKSAAPPPPEAAMRASTIAAMPPPPPAPPPAEEPEPPLAEETVDSPSVLEQALAAEGRRTPAEDTAELERALEKAAQPAARAVWAYELGEHQESRLRDEQAAIKAYGRSLAAEPGHRPTLWALRRLFYKRALWTNLVKLIDAERKLAPTPADRADLLVEKAAILDRTGDRDGAAAALAEAVTEDPRHLVALMGREASLAPSPQTPGMPQLLRQLADASQDPARKAMYLVDLARHHAREGAAGCLVACKLLEEALALGRFGEVIAREWERIAERTEDDEHLVRALEGRVRAILDEHRKLDAESPAAVRRAREAVAVRRRLAAVHTASGRREAAWSVLEEAHALDPGNLLVLEDLAETAGALGWWEAAAQTCFELESRASTPPRRQRWARQRAAALDRAGKPAEAAAALGAAVRSSEAGSEGIGGLAPRQVEAMAAGRWADVLALLVEEGEAALAGRGFGVGGAPAHDWAAAAFTWAGDVAANRLGEDDAARGAYERALAAVPGHAPAAWALAWHHMDAGRLDDACRLLEAIAGGAGAGLDEALEILVRLYGEQGKAAEQLAAATRLAELRPDDEALLWRMQELLGQAGESELRVRMLSRLAAVVTVPERRASVLREVARIQAEELEDVDAAIRSHGAALEADPDDAFAGAALARLLWGESRWQELADLRRRQGTALRAAGHDAAAAAALRDAGHIRLYRADHPADAATTFREALVEDPADERAARGLEVAASAAGDIDGLITALEHAQGSAPVAEQGLVALALADAYLAADRVPAARAALERAAGDERARPHAIWAQFELACRTRDEAAQAEALAALGHAPGVSVEAGWLSMHAPEVAAARLERGDSVSAALGRVVAATRADNVSALARATSDLAARVQDPAFAAVLGRRAAMLGGAPVPETGDGDPDGLPPDAASRLHGLCVRARTELAAGRVGAAGRLLAEVLDEDAHHREALLLLRRAARRSGDWETLARVCLRLAAAFHHPETQARFYAQAAQLVEKELGRPLNAAPLWRMALDKMPGHDEAYRRAHTILTDAGHHAALVELLTSRLDNTASPEAQVPLLVERARAFKRRGSREAAERDLAAALEMAPDHEEASTLLELIRSSPVRRHPSHASDPVPQVARAVTAPPSSSAVQALLATGTREALREARDLEPTNVEVIRRLVEVTRGRERKEVLATALAALRAALADNRTSQRHVRGLMNVAAVASDPDLVFFTMGALVGLGGKNKALVTEYGGRRQELMAQNAMPRREITAEEWNRVVHPEAHVPVTEAWRCIASAVTRLSPHEPGLLGFTREQKQSPQAVAARFPLLAGYLDAVGLPRADVYISEARGGYARALALDTVTLFLGADVAAAATPETRFALGRAVAQGRDRAGALPNLRDTDLRLSIAAAMFMHGMRPDGVAHLAPAADDEGALAVRADLIDRHLGKKERKLLAALVPALTEPVDFARWRFAMTATAARGGLLLAGDLAAALAAVTPGGPDASPEGTPEAGDLVTWAVSEEHLRLRKELGL